MIQNDIYVYNIILAYFIIERFMAGHALLGELIYTCKMIQPGIFSRFSQPVYFSKL